MSNCKNIEYKILDIERNGSITFGDNTLKLESNGDIYIHGRLVENDKEVVNAIREFLNNLK